MLGFKLERSLMYHLDAIDSTVVSRATSILGNAYMKV